MLGFKENTMLGQKALVAQGFPGFADVPAMEDQPVMGCCEFFFRDVFHQLQLGLQRIFGSFGKPDPGSHPEDVGVDRHGRLVESYRSDHIGGFPAYAGKFLKGVDISGNLAAKILYEHLRHP